MKIVLEFARIRTNNRSPSVIIIYISVVVIYKSVVDGEAAWRARKRGNGISLTLCVRLGLGQNGSKDLGEASPKVTPLPNSWSPAIAWHERRRKSCEKMVSLQLAKMILQSSLYLSLVASVRGIF